MSKDITKKSIEALASKLLLDWGLDDWTFKWNTNKTRIGVCKYRNKSVEVSAWIFDNIEIDKRHLLIDTVKHEVAHALAGPGKGHGTIWKRWAVKLGAVPRARKRLDLIDPKRSAKWLLVDTSQDDKIIKVYYREPTLKRIATVGTLSVRGRPQSRGRLKFVRV